MKILAIVSQKGGAGKTTIAVSMAVAAKLAGLSVLLVDLDPQATATKWGDRRGETDELVVMSAQAARLPQILLKAQEGGADLVIIDTPPRVEQAAMMAAKAASAILIPCLPAINDLETIPSTMELLKFAGQPPAVVVLNGMPPGESRREQAAHVVADMSVPISPVSLGHRTAFRDSAMHGQSAQEYEASGKASFEIQLLYKFVSELLNKRTNKQKADHA